MVDLTGRVALVTGASRGIGRAVAVALAQNGADVALNYLAMEQEARITQDQVIETGRRAIIIQADVSRASEVERMVKTVEKELGPIEVLVNNAGISRVIPIDALTEADWDETLSVNLKAAFLVTQAVLPAMRKLAWGRIINIGSGAAHTGGHIGPHYTASKAGIEGLTRGYASRLVKEGITVNAIAPSLIDTDMIKDDPELAKRIPIGRKGRPEEVAQAVLFASGNAYMTGQTIMLNGGIYFR